MVGSTVGCKQTYTAMDRFHTVVPICCCWILLAQYHPKTLSTWTIGVCQVTSELCRGLHPLHPRSRWLRTLQGVAPPAPPLALVTKSAGGCTPCTPARAGYDLCRGLHPCNPARAGYELCRGMHPLHPRSRWFLNVMEYAGKQKHLNKST
jgi:hypothetical protein